MEAQSHAFEGDRCLDKFDALIFFTRTNNGHRGAVPWCKLPARLPHSWVLIVRVATGLHLWGFECARGYGGACAACAFCGWTKTKERFLMTLFAEFATHMLYLKSRIEDTPSWQDPLCVLIIPLWPVTPGYLAMSYCDSQQQQQ